VVEGLASRRIDLALELIASYYDIINLRKDFVSFRRL
jgi:hypothetical protein